MYWLLHPEGPSGFITLNSLETFKYYFLAKYGTVKSDRTVPERF